MELKQVTHIDNVRLSDDGRAVRILDQSLLPNETIYLELQTPEELYEAIATLRVRGAPAIGIFAGYALYVLALQTKTTSYADFLAECQKNRDYLNSSRPTAVNLRHMLDRVLAVVQSMPCADISAIQAAMGQMAKAIHEEDIAMCTAISEYGLSLVKAGDGILTHCNAGPLATSRYGTGLGPLFLAQERGIPLHAFCDETRPLLQGARLTAYELQRAGIDVHPHLRQHGQPRDEAGQDQRLLRRLRPSGPERGHRQQDRHLRRGDLSQALRHPLLRPRPLLHHRLHLPRRGPHPHRAAGRGGDQREIFLQALFPAGGQVLQPRL